MEDSRIVDLYWQRSSDAITESTAKYGSYCHAIALRILGSHPDAEECVNDTWIGAWNAMPVHRPACQAGAVSSKEFYILNAFLLI